MSLEIAKNLTGNIGEWSEIYVFLKLLAEGRLNAADANLNVISNIYYPIIKIIRQESNIQREFVLNGNIEVYNPFDNILLYSIAKTNFIEKSKELFENLKIARGRSFSFPEIEDFLKGIDINNLAAISKEKTDIRIVVHDLNTGLAPTLGFSIKSMLGKKSTLFNPGAGTNFIFKIERSNLEPFDLSKFNTDSLHKSKKPKALSKIAIRIKDLEALGFSIKFHSIQSENLKLNLEIIDSKLPEILAFMLFYKYRNAVSTLTSLLEVLNSINPLKFDLSKGHPFYDVKLKSFLTESALGMTPEAVWTGLYDATGGIIVVKKTGDLVCYHIYNKSEFQDYLLKNTRLEQAATDEDDDNPGNPKKVKPYRFGWVYKENHELFIKLNLQVRFK